MASQRRVMVGSRSTGPLPLASNAGTRGNATLRQPALASPSADLSGVTLPHLTWRPGATGRSLTWSTSAPQLHAGSQGSGKLNQLSFLLPLPQLPGHEVSLPVGEAAKQVRPRRVMRGPGSGPSRVKKLSTMDRRLNMQAALAADRQYVQQVLVETAEDPHEREAREQAVDEQWWAAVFSPVPAPRSMLPAVFAKWHHPPLPDAKPSSPVRPMDCEELPKLHDEEMDDVVRVCTRFHALVTEHLPDSGGSLPTLSRPSFCRLVCALGGLAAAPGERTWLRRSVSHFDRLAEKISARGPGGSVTGFLLAHSAGANGTGLPQLPDLPIITLFSYLLFDMIEDLERMTTSENRLVATSRARARLFDTLIPQAEEYAKERAEMVRKQVESGGPPRRTAVPDGTASVAATTTQGETTPVGKGSARPSVDAAAAGSVGGKGKSAGVSSVGSTAGAEGGEDDEEDEGDGSVDLYAHTFAVLKGENLTSQLLEPEVIHFVAEFSDVFRHIFRAYADVPLAGADGHMTLSALLRFCDDFGLFPTRVDFQTIQWLYNSAANSDGPDPEPEHSGPEPMPLPVPSAKSLTQEPPRRRRRKGSDFAPPVEDGFLFYGKWMKAHLAWLTKDFGAMSQVELSSALLLWSISEWMENQRLGVKEIFGLLDVDSSGAVSVQELQTGVEFMKFEDPPSAEDIHQMAQLLIPPALQEKQEVDFLTMQMAIVAVSKQREKRDRAANCFLKDFAKMTREESNACIFFRDLWAALERSKLTPLQIFRRFDVNGDGSLSSAELTQKAQQLLKMQPTTNQALSIENPFELLDLNGDGEISCEEFCNVLDQMKQAREKREFNNAGQHPILLGAAASMTNSGQPKRMFGHRAFIECLMKIALVRLGYHGTAIQAEQPSICKVLWMLLFLRWQFDQAKQRLAAAKRPGTRGLGGARFPSYLAPLRRLVKYHPQLFAGAPAVPPLKAAAQPSSSLGPCSACGAAPFCGWGSAVCLECCQADSLLSSCLVKDAPPAARGTCSLDRLLCKAETGS